MNDDTLINVKLTLSQIRNLVEFIELEFIDSIRRDEDIDNMDYIVCMSEAFKTLRDIQELCEGSDACDNQTNT